MESNITELERKAEEIKNEGNKFYKGNYLKQAIEQYKLAIETLPPTHLRRAVYLCNKSMCSLKLEEPGQALLDAEEAIKTDPKNIKAYYRKAIAQYALNKLKDAINSLKEITTTLKVKNNKDVNAKLKLLKKIQKERNFLKAIEYEDDTDQLDPNSLSIPETYKGPRLEDGESISYDWIMDLIHHLKGQKKVHKKFVWKMLQRMVKLLDSEPNLNFLQVKDGIEREDIKEGVPVPKDLDYSYQYKKFDDVRYVLPKITVCGDIHGKFMFFWKFVKFWRLTGLRRMYMFTIN